MEKTGGECSNTRCWVLNFYGAIVQLLRHEYWTFRWWLFNFCKQTIELSQKSVPQWVGLCKFYTFWFLFSNIHLFVFFKQILYILTEKYLSFQKIGCWLTQKFPSKNCRHPHFFHYLCACYSCGCPTANGGGCYSPLPIGHPRDFPNEEISWASANGLVVFWVLWSTVL